MKMFQNYVEAAVAQHCKCIKCHWIIYLEMLILDYVNLTSVVKKSSYPNDMDTGL